MVISDEDREAAEKRMDERLQAHPIAIRARYDRRKGRIFIRLNTGVDVAFRPNLAEGLQGASADDLAQIEITPTGQGLHWPTLDADIYLPGLLAGLAGTKPWLRDEAADSPPKPKRKTA